MLHQEEIWNYTQARLLNQGGMYVISELKDKQCATRMRRELQEEGTAKIGIWKHGIIQEFQVIQCPLVKEARKQMTSATPQEPFKFTLVQP